MSEKPSGSKRVRNVSRREMLAMTGVTVAGGVAGCSGSQTTETSTETTTGESTSSGGGETETTTGGEVEYRDPVPTGVSQQLWEDKNYNRYARNIALSGWFPEYLWHKNYAGEVYDYKLLEEDGFWYDSETRELHYKFKEDYYWWDGTQATAEDYYNQQEIDRLMDPEGSEYEYHELVDDFHVVTKRKEPLNPILINPEEGRLWTRRDKNKKWVDKLEDASSDKQRDEVIAELTETKIPIDQLVEEGLGLGIYKPKSWNEKEQVLELHEKHPRADQAAFDEVNFKVAKNGSAKDQLIINDEIDYQRTTFQDTWSKAPDYLQTVFKGRGVQPRTLVFNQKDNGLKHRGVRRAFISLLDFPKLKKIHKKDFLKKYQTGLPAPLESQWLGQDYLDDIIKYPMEPDLEKAEEFLKMDGLEKSNGVWKDSDGEPVKFTVYTPPWAVMAAYGKSMAQQCSEFGFEVEAKTAEGGTWYQDFLNMEGGDVFPFGHGWSSLEPLNYYNYDNHYKMRLGPNAGTIEDWLDQGKTQSPLNGRNIVLDLPKEVGGADTSSGSKTVNVYELIEELKVTQSKDRTAEITKTLAQYFNYDLPLLDVFPNTFGGWGDTKDFEYPDKDHPAWLNYGAGLRQQIQNGQMRGVPKDQ